MLDDTSQSLLERAKGNQQGAMCELLELIRPYVIIKAKSFGATQQADQEEIAQEVCRKVWVNLAEFRYQGKYSFRGWVSRITRNHASSFFSKRTKQTKLEQVANALGRNLSHVLTSPELELMDLEELHEVLWEYVKPSLNESHARIYDLMWRDKLTPTEAAERTGESSQFAANVRKRVYSKIRNLAWEKFGIQLLEI
ncbi:MAG: sigma-70 family RNA polymerase sigma factor [Planctomycetota bacterium]